MKRSNTLAWVALACAVGLNATVHAADTPERLKKAGKLVIATNPNYPPLAYKNIETGELTGLDVELGNAIGKQLGVKVEWQETSFSQVFSSLATGRVDMAMVAITDTPERQQSADFIDYLLTGAQFYTLSTAPANIRALPDLCGKRVGASRNTTWPAQIATWSQANCVARGAPAVVVVGTEGSVDARAQLKSGRLDAGVQGSETMPYFKKLEPNTYLTIGDPFLATVTGIPVSKKEPEVRDAILAAIRTLQANGEYDALLKKYDLGFTRYDAALNQGK
ncbi:ABC transporter substrate-binding protein [Schauerella aestuarii]|uniref:ABC transporter substrate-binding protein n=1 Tax=Schauerella aestuarii TaxID=2511204 RepID=UPI0013684009|nr:ABC transporter substrate-binding protein [Achromobacter aestuarii]MYZ41637.1 ABC transporter substrate-binding protein [Achromobacter aestuarii]